MCQVKPHINSGGNKGETGAERSDPQRMESRFELGQLPASLNFDPMRSAML